LRLIIDDSLQQLGPLELQILQYVWRHGESTVKEAYEEVVQRRDISHKTVQSALKRLYDKQLLHRSKVGRAYAYSPRKDQTEVTEERISEIVDQIAEGQLDVALHAFVNIADDAGEETLDRLERLIEQRRGDDES
jgi:predicted transcriptional regulator